MTRVKQLSYQQRRMLRDAQAGDHYQSIRGQSMHGGARGTHDSLVKLGLLTWEGKLTKAGRAALRDQP